MSFFSFARIFRGPVNLNRIYSVAFLPERVSCCGIASKKAERPKRPAEHPKRPKRPAGPYAAFASEYYQATRNENPEAKVGDIFELLATKWRSLLDTEKDKYQSDYKKKLAAFNAPLLKLPRRPATAFAQFVRDKYAEVERENPDASAPEVIKIIAGKWKEIPEHEKESLKEAYEGEKRDYQRRVVEFDENLSKDEREFLEHFKGSKMQQLYKERLKLLNFPKKPATAFALFLSLEKERFPRDSDEKPSDWVKRMATTWKEMSDKEKDVYRHKSKRAVAKYEDKVLDWQNKHGQ